MEGTNIVQALEALYERRAKNEGQAHIDNEDLWAGSPMYYYCRACDEEMRLPETHPAPAPYLCVCCEHLQGTLGLRDGWYAKPSLVEWTEDDTGLTGYLITLLGIPRLYLRRPVHLGRTASLSEAVQALGEGGFMLFDPDALYLLAEDHRQLWMSRVRSVVSADLHDHANNVGRNLLLVDGEASVEDLDFGRDFTGLDWFLVTRDVVEGSVLLSRGELGDSEDVARLS